jgi:hypothetical protein
MQGILVPIGGAFLFLVILLQVLMGRRVIQLKGPLHMKVHTWTGYALLVAAPVHGLFATHTFLGWPF